MFINGEWITGVMNPATDETVYEVHTGGKPRVEKAIEAAKQAFLLGK